MKGILVANLPKTFRDAITITRSLDIQYLWIDSLCIIQDDPDDWTMESTLMERVYSSAYVTLAASCASGIDDGFLKSRPQRECVKMETPDGVPYYVCNTVDDFSSDVDQGELNKRAWVLQERALSRRTIYFTANQSYWECGRGVRCETLTEMTNRRASFLGDANFPHSINTYVRGMKIQLFQELYVKYSELGLTSSGDRPVAIRGLEIRMCRTFGTAGGYGVFECFLHRCLLWRRLDTSQSRIDSSRGGSVPTWSWMAYDGGIRYMVVPFGGAFWAQDIVSPFKKLHPQGGSDGDDLGRFKEMKVTVWEILGAEEQDLMLDESGRTFTQPFRCVVVGTDKKTEVRYVLVVYSVDDNQKDIVERVGVAELRKDQIAVEGSRRCVLK